MPILHTLERRQRKRMCPTCETVMDGATQLAHENEELVTEMPVGAITICAYCGTFLRVEETTMSLLPQQEIDEACIAHPMLRTIVDQIKKRKDS